MIKIADIFEDIKNNVGAWCPVTDDDTDLVKIADGVILAGTDIVSAPAGVIARLWSWLEQTNAQIVGRFYVEHVRGGIAMEIPDLVQNINMSFKQGASGAQVFMSVRDLPQFVAEIKSVRDDLFFNRMLTIGLDIGEIAPSDWNDIFDLLIQIRASSLMLIMTRDTGNKSDFVGRAYAMLKSWNVNFNGDLYWNLGNNAIRIEQALRLMADIRPELVSNARFFMVN